MKRSVLTWAHGIPLAVVVDGANRHDMKLAEATLTDLMVPRPLPTLDKPQGFDWTKVMTMTRCASW